MLQQDMSMHKHALCSSRQQEGCRKNREQKAERKVTCPQKVFLGKFMRSVTQALDFVRREVICSDVLQKLHVSTVQVLYFYHKESDFMY